MITTDVTATALNDSKPLLSAAMIFRTISPFSLLSAVSNEVGHRNLRVSFQTVLGNLRPSDTAGMDYFVHKFIIISYSCSSFTLCS